MRLNWKLGAPAALVSGAALLGVGLAPAAPRPAAPDLVELPPGGFAYRMSGEFTRAGQPVPAPLVATAVARPLAIMRHEVTAGEYQRCADAGACAPAAPSAPDRPVIEVSWRDATAYAAWLSHETGWHFRLPTDAEWAYAAAERFTDDALPQDGESADPGRRALLRYDRVAGDDRPTGAEPQPIGSFGANRNELLDMAGNVWEWTDTCYARTSLDPSGDAGGQSEDCWIRTVEGRHRTYLSDFLRTARGGGCSVGIPVTNLGFRLVRDEASSTGLRRILRWALLPDQASPTGRG